MQQEYFSVTRCNDVHERRNIAGIVLIEIISQNSQYFSSRKYLVGGWWGFCVVCGVVVFWGGGGLGGFFVNKIIMI